MRSSDHLLRRLVLRLRARVGRGYALMLVVVATLLVVTAAGIALAVARESTLAASNETRAAAAHAAATTGLQWMLTNLSSPGGKALVVQAAVAAPDTAVAVTPGPRNVYRFNANGKYAGVPTEPPAVGTSTTDWSAFEGGHFGLLAAVDPLDQTRSVLIRSIGVVGASQVVLETNLQLTPTQNLPAGMTGCFPAGFEITFYDQEGPYDYVGNFRLDGTLGVPLAVSADHDRINGLARTTGSTLGGALETGTQRGVKWRGQQNLRAPCDAATQTCAPSAKRVANIFGGTRLASGSLAANLVDDDAAPFAGWSDNPYLSNDPRLVDAFDAATMRGFGLGGGGGVYDGNAGSSILADATVTQVRGLPLIAFNDAPSDFGGEALLGESLWGGKKDDEARKGFYACDNHSAGTTRNSSVDVCLVGKTDGGTPDWKSGAVNHSGRAWGFLQSVVRQCTGSGSSINPVDGTPWWHPTDNPNGVRCANGFEWLENLAACLIVPREAARSAQAGANTLRDVNPAASGAEFSDGIANNNFSGCHPACLIAADIDGDGAIDDDDRPFRSSCINLDSTRLAHYGPGMLSTREQSVPNNTDTAAVDDGDLDPIPEAEETSRWMFTPETQNDAARPEDDVPAANMNLTAFRWTRFLKTVSTDLGIHNNAKAAKFRGPDGIVRVGGAVRERGNIHLVTRLDMSDRGPLGTCEQNCLAYGFGKDRTYGAHRNGQTAHYTSAPVTDTSDVTFGTTSKAGTAADARCVAEVTQNVSSGTPVLQACNWDSDYDGRLDRVSLALNSAYREECVSQQDGVAWSPAFNISSENETIARATPCMNDLPGMSADTAPLPITQFCDSGAEDDLRADIERILAVAQEVQPDAFKHSTGTLTNNDGWWGGAKCHMGQGVTFDGASHDTVTPHSGNLTGLNGDDEDHLGRPDYWIEDTCPNPVVVRLKENSNVDVGMVCGCGILVIPDNTLTLKTNAHLLWRGLVIWDMKAAGKELRIDGSGASTFVVDGGMLMTGTEALQVNITKKVDDDDEVENDVDGTVKQLYRFNQTAVNDAFKAVPLPVRAIRRLR